VPYRHDCDDLYVSTEHITAQRKSTSPHQGLESMKMTYLYLSLSDLLGVP